MLRFLCAVLLLLAAATPSHRAPAVSHEYDGFWWNPAESGRGWAIASQAGTAFITHYAYTTTGAPTFFSSIGRWTPIAGGQGNVGNELFLSVGGPCIGCPYRAPSTSVIGTARFEFSSFNTGRIVYDNGTVIPIQRFVFALPPGSRGVLKGGWLVTIAGSGVFFGTSVTVLRNCTVPECAGLTQPFEGHLDDIPSRVLVGAQLPDGSIVMLGDAGAGFDRQILVRNLMPNRFAGTTWLYPDGSSPPPLSAVGLLYAASRLLGANDVGASEMPAAMTLAMGPGDFAGIAIGGGIEAAAADGGLAERNRVEAGVVAAAVARSTDASVAFDVEIELLRRAAIALQQRAAAEGAAIGRRPH